MGPAPAEKRLLGAPLGHLALCLAISGLMAGAFFYPAIASFGQAMIGVEDMKLFVWLFWHYDNAFTKGTDPLSAPEIFYPSGISLARTSLIPMLTLTYHFLPAAWGVYGKITAIQLLTFLLGGVFSFALCYRFVRSFVPAMAGSVAYNFSMFHLQAAIHHLNYASAMPFVALFFIFYFEMPGIPGTEAGKKSIAEGGTGQKEAAKPLSRKRAGARAETRFGAGGVGVRALFHGIDLRLAALMALSLLLVSLNELTVSVMCGFIVFIDVISRYMGQNGVRIEDRLLPLSASVLAALALSTYLSLGGYPDAVTYVAPSLVFIGTIFFFVVGPEGLWRSEREHAYLRMLAAASLPTLAFIAAIALAPSYPFAPDSPLLNAVVYAVPLQYLFLPTDMSLESRILPSLESFSESGVYLGIGLIAVVAASYLIRGAQGGEMYFRRMAFLSLLFAFPVIAVGDQVIGATPFFAMPLFPLLGLLRVPARFMLFAFLFASILAALVIQRLLSSKDGRLLAALLVIALVADRVPDYGGYLFAPQVPAFYSGLAAEGNATLFLAPTMSYPSMLDEMYYQTLHGKPISFGVVSRSPEPPSGGNESVYSVYSGRMDYGGMFSFAKEAGYTYVIVHKQICADRHSCFIGRLSPADGEALGRIEGEAQGVFGPPAYQDDSIAVYRNG